MKSIYDIQVMKRENRQDVAVSLSEYKGQVLLISIPLRPAVSRRNTKRWRHSIANTKTVDL